MSLDQNSAGGLRIEATEPIEEKVRDDVANHKNKKKNKNAGVGARYSIKTLAHD